MSSWGELIRRAGSALSRGSANSPLIVPRGRLYLGRAKDGGYRFSRPERAVLVIGPPRSGKTTGVIVPALLAHDGPAVSTSTKPDVLTATSDARSKLGVAWEFNPAGGAPQRPGVIPLRWSPLRSSTDWDRALLMARAMVVGGGVGRGVTDSTHWARRAQALLAPLLHAAATGGRDMEAVLEWVARQDVQEPRRLLARTGANSLATATLDGLAATEARERSAIFSAAADALEAYSSAGALAASREPNFDPYRFVQSHDTIYIHAPAEQQHMAAPLVCGMLAEIRRATYQARHLGYLQAPVLFALDEVANIAPLPELPAMASEGGGQGLLLLAALQDLSQARVRWDAAADGFLTLFGTKLILPGVADTKTLEAVSVLLGEYDRQVVSHSRTKVPGQWAQQTGQTVSTQRTRVLSPGQIAKLPAGQALHLDGVQWEMLTLTRVYST